MDEYKVTIKLLSETMPGSGMSVPGIIDSDIRHNKYGCPYINAKTFKGYLREQMEALKKYSNEYRDIDINKLLGSDDKESNKKRGLLYFSKIELSEAIRTEIECAIDDNKLTVEEFLDAITVTYTRTKINELGVVEPHSLRTERELKRNLLFETMIYSDSLSELEAQFLEDSVKMIKRIGMHKSKGKGIVDCRLEKK